MDPPSILPVAEIDPLVVIIPVDDMLHGEVQVSTDVWSPSENPFLFLDHAVNVIISPTHNTTKMRD